MKHWVNNVRERIKGQGDDFSKKRNAQIAKSITSGIAAKVISMASGLITIPMTLKYLGVEQFGIWMAITSFVGFIGFTDLGLGIGLQNALSQCHGKDDRESPKLYISNAYFLVGAMATLMLLVAFTAICFLPVENLIKIKTATYANHIKDTFLVVVCISLAGIPAGLIQRILFGYQKGNVANMLNLIGSIIALGGIFISVYLKLSLPALVALFVGTPLIVNFIYSIYYFLITKEHRPNIFKINRRLIKELTGTGLWSMLAQLAYLLKVNLPVLIISSTIGTTAVAQYTTTQKIFGIVGMVTTMALQPLWPAYGEAYHRGDYKWMRNTFNRSIKIIALISLPAFVFMSFLGIPIIDIWTDTKDVLPSYGLLIACNLSIVGLGFNTAFAMVANGTNNLKPPTIIGLFVILAAVFVANYYGFIIGLSANFFTNDLSKNTASVESIAWTFTVLCDIFPAILYYKISNKIITRMQACK